MNRWKNEQNNWLTRSLFIEWCPKDVDEALYTLDQEDKVVDGKTYPSLYKLYIEMEDLHEVSFARKYFGGYQHWKRIAECQFMKEYITEWREELELLFMSRGMETLKDEISSKGRGSTVAAKYFLDRAWDQGIHTVPGGNVKRGRGRPTKESLQSKVFDKDNVSVLQDYKRLLEKSN